MPETPVANVARGPGAAVAAKPSPPLPRRTAHSTPLTSEHGPQRDGSHDHGLPEASAGQRHRARLAARSAGPPARRAVRQVRGGLALPRLRRFRLGPPGQGGVGGSALLAAGLRRSRRPHRGPHRPRGEPQVDRRDPRDAGARRVLRAQKAAHPAPRRPGLLAVPAASPSAALTPGVHRGRADGAVHVALPALHARPGPRRLQLRLGVQALGRQPRRRLLALPPHGGALPP